MNNNLKLFCLTSRFNGHAEYYVAPSVEALYMRFGLDYVSKFYDVTVLKEFGLLDVDIIRFYLHCLDNNKYLL